MNATLIKTSVGCAAAICCTAAIGQSTQDRFVTSASGSNWTIPTGMYGNPACGPCDCNTTGGPYAYNDGNNGPTGDTNPITLEMGNFSLPRHWVVSRLSLDIMARYNTDDTVGFAFEWRFRIPGVMSWTAWNSASARGNSGNCEYRLNDRNVTALLPRAVTVQELDTLQVQVRRVVDGRNSRLRVRTVRARVTAEPPAPANDNCASAQTIAEGIHTVSNVGATTDGTSGCGGLSDVWYRFVPSDTGHYEISTCGFLDTVLSVKRGCSGPEIACNDDDPCFGPDYSSYIETPLTAGVDYRIRVATYSGERDVTELTVRRICPADFNRDGQVDFFDYLDFIIAFSREQPEADFNRDGQIDFFDYLDFINRFSAGC